MKPINVFRHVRYVSRRDDPTSWRYSVELIARGTGTVMYRSAVRDTREEAQALCTRYLAKNPHLIDTTTLSYALKGT